MNDEFYMRRALFIAKANLGYSFPNPSVGCVIVKEGEILAEGATQPGEGDHAEMVALKKLGMQAQGATAYVTLIPCFEKVKNPSCNEIVLNSGIIRVVYGVDDPHPSVNKHSINTLQSNGVEVVECLGEEAMRVHEFYVKHSTTRMPFVIQKSVMSLDGKTATTSGGSKWISSKEERIFTHQLRKEVDAILVGIGTVLNDDPQLTCRLVEGKDPLRIVVDSTLRVPLDAKVFKDTNIVIATTNNSDRDKEERLQEMGVKLIKTGDKKVDLRNLFNILGEQRIRSILIEGGSEINAFLLAEKLVDKVVYTISPVIIGGKEAKTPIGGQGIKEISQALKVKDISMRRLGNDIIIEGYV